ncbi:MAG TPA: glycoside hydrolase domain-containing protein, partial [Cyclobacteriaceae bacterium]|nr:glycoside hydrolase domain-containing protein [Cyclobacteriaceae bacterium]
MRPLRLTGLIVYLVSLSLMFSCTKSQEEQEEITDYSQYVNPMIGTGGHGHTFPGATLPFGMVQISPDNGKNGWDWCSGYHYSSDSIVGFSHTHISGTGIGDMLDVSVMPSSVNIPITSMDTMGFDISPYYATFSHDDEEASPGYYRVLLKESGIQAEFTASYRSAFHRYSFPGKDTVSMIIDLGFHVNWDAPVDTHVKVISDSLVTGFRFSNGWAANQKVYFAMRFSKSLFAFYGSGKDTLYISDPRSIESPSSLAVLKFNIAGDPVIMVKVGLSSVSEENALINLNAELPDWDFEKARASARRAWNRELSRIEVAGGSPDQRSVFYTA